MNFQLTKEQEFVRKMVREFATNEVEPIAADIDQEHRFPTETVEKMAKYGLMGIPFPTEYGGAGGDHISYAITVEELSRVCASTGVICSVHTSLCCWPLLLSTPKATLTALQVRLIRPCESGLERFIFEKDQGEAAAQRRPTQSERKKRGMALQSPNGSDHMTANGGRPRAGAMTSPVYFLKMFPCTANLPQEASRLAASLRQS